MASLGHVAVDKLQLEGIVRCPPTVLGLLAPLLNALGALAEHPGFMQPHSIDSVGWHIDEANPDECRARLLSGTGLHLVYKMRQYDVLFCEAAERLPSEQRRQCLAVRGSNEVARRLDPTERGSAEIVVAFPGGGALTVRKHRDPRRMVVVLASAQKKRKVVDAVLADADAPKLAQLFDEAARGQRQAVAAPSATSKHVKVENGSFWELPSWYASAVALLAQDVFRVHALLSATSQQTSRALFLDRVTAHRMDTDGDINKHHTLIKGALHRASGGCACLLHRDKAPDEAFKRLEFRMEFCGCPLEDGKCKRHCLAERIDESARFPGVCMKCLSVELRCTHEFSKKGRGTGGIRVPFDVGDERMDLAYTKDLVRDIASCGARLMAPSEDRDLQPDMAATLANLAEARARHAHIGDAMLHHDIVAVYLLRQRTTVTKAGRFVGRVRADCNSILKTHKHLFKMKLS